MSTSQRLSLRDEALARQRAVRQQQQQQQYQYEYRQHPPQYQNQYQPQYQNQYQTQRQYQYQVQPQLQQQPQPQPQQQNQNYMTAEDARKQWRQHGEGLSQSLEDRRTQLTASARGTNPDAYVSNSALAYSVRVMGVADRIDPSGSVFTVYVIEVEAVGRPRMTVEHRYSEFAKLNKDLVTNGVKMRASFPGKITLAGRIGNWTPTFHVKKDKRYELITYRKIKLDIWLVELAEKLVRGDIEIINVALKDRIIEFFEKSDALVPPCDRTNQVQWSSLQGKDEQANDDNDNQKIKHSAGLERHIGNPISHTMGGEVRKAVYTVLNMCGKGALSSDRSIPLDLLHQARGLCFLTVAKGGLIFSGKVGTGLVVARQSDGGWSPPSAIGTVGIGWGAQIGADLSSYLIVLNNDEAVRAFSSKGSINLGAELVVAVGTLGRSATGNMNAGDGGIAPAYAYGHSKGFFAGISLEGSILKCRDDINSNFYGRPVEPAELLFGSTIPRPRAAQPLYEALNEALDVPITGFRPSELRKKRGTGYYQSMPVDGSRQSPVLNYQHNDGAAISTADLAYQQHT